MASSDEGNEHSRFLFEAKRLKHAADAETDHLKQAMIYLEAVLYFLLTGIAMERELENGKVAFVMFADTLTLVKYISGKYRHQQGNIHSKVAILCRRCLSLICFKLYKLCQNEMNNSHKTLTHNMDQLNMTEEPEGNTPSVLSPPNLKSSRSNRSLIQVHEAFEFESQVKFYNYLVRANDFWEQADALIATGNNADFFIALDHQNGPITLHSPLSTGIKYMQDGLQQLNAMHDYDYE